VMGKIVKIGGSFTLAEEVYAVIYSLVPEGGTILELGSGLSTRILNEKYKVYTVEHKMKYINHLSSLPNATLFYASVDPETNWYDREVIKQIPRDHDLILVDGPIGDVRRLGFGENYDLFKQDVPVIFDDVNRPNGYKSLTEVAGKMGRNCTIYNCHELTHFGVVIP